VGPACRREGREKVPWQKGTNPKGNRNNDSTPTAREPAGEAVPTREATACRDGWAGVGETGLVGPDSRRRFQRKLIFIF
jgi:hypothetical protein